MPDSVRSSLPFPITLIGKALLLGRIWMLAAVVAIALRARSLDEVVRRLGHPSRRESVPPEFLSRAVSRGLRIGRWQPRCLIRSLVLYRLLRAQGDVVELVIGLTDRPMSADAHAWIELDGRDLGPAPGRGSHRELVRYPRHPSRAGDRPAA